MEQLLAYGVVDDVSSRPVPEQRGSQGIEAFLSEKVRGLGEIVRDVRGEISRRAHVSHDVVGRIYQQYLYLKTKLLELYIWPLGANRSVEQRRLGLEGMLDLLLRERRNEQVKCTEEVARLKIELWRWLKEYLELAQRVRLVVDGGRRYHG